MSWVTPTGHSTFGGTWLYPERARDDNLTTWGDGWSVTNCEDYGIVFTHAPLSSDKVRFYISGLLLCDNLRIRVRNADTQAWETVYTSDSPPQGQWVECPFSQRNVDRMEVRVHSIAIPPFMNSSIHINEVAFWKIPSIGYNYSDGLASIVVR